MKIDKLIVILATISMILSVISILMKTSQTKAENFQNKSTLQCTCR